MKLRNQSTPKSAMKSSVRLASALFFGLTFVLATNAYPLELYNKTLRYSVYYTTHNAGELEISVERDGDVVKSKAVSHLSTIAQMFLSGQTVETWFELDRERARVLRGQLLDHEEKEVTASFDINRKAGFVEFKDEDAVPIEDGDVFESTSFPMVLITSDLSKISGTSVREVNPKRIRYYVYQDPVEETLELDGKNYDTWRVTRNKRGEEDRTVTFWLEKESQVPLKIISSKSGKDTVMTLISAD